MNCKGNLIDLSHNRVMGIINITPDSFYESSRYQTSEDIRKRIKTIIYEGADFVDIGAYSSRPGAKHITHKEEWHRLQPALEITRNEFPDTIVAIDTFRADIARKAVEEYGVAIINDISAGNMDKNMFDTVADLRVPYVMMHMQGTPRNMQKNPHYDCLLKEISLFFAEKTNILKSMGVNDIIIDPGFGFGKTIDHNYKLLKHLAELHIADFPILVGLSRKSMIYKYLKTTPKHAGNGTTVLNTVALLNGANILRVHDVKLAVEAVKLTQKLITE